MTNTMPERIEVGPWDRLEGLGGEVEYIRGDLVGALDKAAAQAFDLIDRTIYEGGVDEDDIYADCWAEVRDELAEAGEAVADAMRGERI